MKFFFCNILHRNFSNKKYLKKIFFEIHGIFIIGVYAITAEASYYSSKRDYSKKN